MRPPIDAVVQAHAHVSGVIAGLDDAQVAGASALPGWTRGHVLAHLSDNARMFARLAEHALRGELVETYDGGMDERNAIIDANAGLSAADHRAAFAEHTDRLEAVWARFGDEDWARPVSFRDADVAATVHARWREAWIHVVDLDLGVRPADWPEALACHAIDFLLSRLPEGTALRAEDIGRDWPAVGGERTVVAGRVRDLAAWIAGRTPAVAPVASGGLPALGPWPPHPVRP